MMKIDPIYLLLLIELSCILAAGVVFLYLRSRKYKEVYQNTLKDLGGAKRDRETLRKQLAVKERAAETASGPPVQDTAAQNAGNVSDVEELRKKLQDAREELDQKDKKMEALQTKFSDLEKEYMVLYQQQQKQQEQPDIP